MKHLVRNSSPDAQIVSSFVRVRNSRPSHADEVAEIEQLENLEGALRQRVLPDVDLDREPPVRDDQEVRLPEAAHRQDAAGRGGLDLLGLELLPSLAAAPADQLVDGVRALEGVRIGVDAELHQLVEVRPPLLVLIRFSGV